MPEGWRVQFSQYLVQQGVPSDLRRAFVHEAGGSPEGEAKRSWDAFQRALAWQSAQADMVLKLRLKHFYTHVATRNRLGVRSPLDVVHA